MPKFMLLVEGTNYTSHVHQSIDNAVAEAERLFKISGGKDVHILEVVGTVKMEKVPVVEEKMVVTLPDRLKGDRLPF